MTNAQVNDLGIRHRVDPTLQHKNRGDVLVSGAEIIIRPVGARQAGSRRPM
jgi:hypothetical protein